MPNIKQIRYLYESYKLGTMRAASEKLDVEPSTVSRQIADLEQSIGIPLIERSRRSVQLTEAGHLTLAYYRDLNACEETYLSDLEALKLGKAGKISLSVGDAMIDSRFEKMLQAFVADHPGISIHADVGMAKSIINRVLDDESHFGLIFHLTKEPKISIRLSVPQPLLAIVNPNHPIASRQRVKFAELGHYPVALPPDTYALRKIVHDVERQEGVFLDCSFSSDSFSLLAWYARSCGGVTLMNESLITEELARGTLKAVPIDVDVFQKTYISLITRSGRTLPPMVNNLLVRTERYLKDSFKTLDQEE